jgi:hypothetical protein
MSAAVAFIQLQKDLSQSSFDGIQELLLIQKSKQLLVKKRGLNIVLENHVGRIAERELKLKNDFLEQHGHELQTLKTTITMSNLFTELAEAMEDRQEVILNIKKIGTDLVIMVTPDLKKKGTVIQLTGNPSEMDLNFMHEFKKPVVAKTEFSSEVVSTDEKPKKKTSSGTTKKTTNRRASQAKSAKKAAPKKAAKKAASAKKAVVKKAAAKKAAPKKGLADLLDKKTNPPKVQEVKKPEPVVDEKKQQEEAAAAKLKADKETFAQLMIDGGKHYDAHEWADAEATYMKATQLFPSDVKANIALANTRKWIRAIEKSLTD